MSSIPLRLGALVLVIAGGTPSPTGTAGLARALAAAESALLLDELSDARTAIDLALEHDPNASAAWALEERWAAKRQDRDAQVYALHRQLSLLRSQGANAAALEAVRGRLAPLDPAAEKLAALRSRHAGRFVEIAAEYEKAERPHSAIRTLNQALALDPSRTDLRATIDRLANAPDPSLADDARPADLLEGISAEWIAEHDAKHGAWKDRAKLERPNYVTYTDCGYEVLVRAAEAMEQMNAFYRVFFGYGAGEDKRNPGRIELRIFRSKDEYLKHGESPAEWSGGQFTGGAVETYIGPGGFEDMTGTLFHEAAHQFVGLATSAEGWLNEGLASFFEGTRILANGTVVMNLPADHRLFPLVERMERGWMKDAQDGIDPKDPNKEPETAPTLRTVLENQYEWGPAWYPPTWGVVYFVYNFQDPSDGRYVYRGTLREYVNASGGKMGEGAVEAFEKVVLAHPEPATPGVSSTLALPATVDEANGVWKDYLVALRDRQTGRVKGAPPYRDWARHARTRGALDDAAEHYERALRDTPSDAELLVDFAGFLVERGAKDRATKLLSHAAALLERAEPVDAARVADVEKRLREIDPLAPRVDQLRTAVVSEARAVIDEYMGAGLYRMAMEVSSHLGAELGEPALLDALEAAIKKSGRSLAEWRLAYDEESMAGWNIGGLASIYTADGERLRAKNGVYDASATDYALLTMDEVTSGDYSIEAQVEAQYGHVVFAGLVFGRKSVSDFHALVLFPPKPARNGFVNLVTFHGAGSTDTWRRNPVQGPDTVTELEKGTSSVATEGKAATYRLRVDVTGRVVDVWVDGKLAATQEFPSTDVLRGSFGLLVGRGEAAFRRVRYLAREPRDPSAEIERALWRADAPAVGANGSWTGELPPFPAVQRWLSGERKGWDEALGHPQLLVLWSIAQNDSVQIDGWLSALAKKHANVGLEVVSVLSTWDGEKAPAYLDTHPFPGAVALDALTDGQGIGTTFERYGVSRFHLPRLVLLDIDGRVAWEGDPGFSSGQQWSGQESLLEGPLRELIQTRKLPELLAWKATWRAARAAIARGDVEAAAAVLEGAAIFDASVTPEVAEALDIAATLEETLLRADALAAELVAAGREPALEALVAWGKALNKPVKETKAVKAALKAESVSAWKRAQAALKPVLARLQAGKSPDALEDALAKVAALPGAFPAELVERARAVASDPAELRRVLEGAASEPARWLASERFGW